MSDPRESVPPNQGGPSGSRAPTTHPRARKGQGFVQVSNDQLAVPEPPRGSIAIGDHATTFEARLLFTLARWCWHEEKPCDRLDREIAEAMGLRGTIAAKKKRVQRALNGRWSRGVFHPGLADPGRGFVAIVRRQDREGDGRVRDLYLTEKWFEYRRIRILSGGPGAAGHPPENQCTNAPGGRDHVVPGVGTTWSSPRDHVVPGVGTTRSSPTTVDPDRLYRSSSSSSDGADGPTPETDPGGSDDDDDLRFAPGEGDPEGPPAAAEDAPHATTEVPEIVEALEAVEAVHGPSTAAEVRAAVPELVPEVRAAAPASWGADLVLACIALVIERAAAKKRGGLSSPRGFVFTATIKLAKAGQDPRPGLEAARAARAKRAGPAAEAKPAEDPGRWAEAARAGPGHPGYEAAKKRAIDLRNQLAGIGWHLHLKEGGRLGGKAIRATVSENHPIGPFKPLLDALEPILVDLLLKE